MIIVRNIELIKLQRERLRRCLTHTSVLAERHSEQQHHLTKALLVKLDCCRVQTVRLQEHSTPTSIYFCASTQNQAEANHIPSAAWIAFILEQQALTRVRNWVFMDLLSLKRFGSLGEATKPEVVASHHSFIFLFMSALHICKSNTVSQWLDNFIQKIAETGPAGALLFRDWIHWPDWVF